MNCDRRHFACFSGRLVSPHQERHRVQPARNEDKAMTRTFAIAAAAIAITAVSIGNSVASPCNYSSYSNRYVAPANTYVEPTYRTYYNGY